MQLQSTLSFMRENDEKDRMSVQSFEHCIEQVVRFHFPNKRNLRHVHWNARHHLINPLWVHASVLDFVHSIQESMIGLLLISGLRESLKGGKKDGPPSANKNTSNFASLLKLWLFEMPEKTKISLCCFSKPLIRDNFPGPGQKHRRA